MDMGKFNASLKNQWPLDWFKIQVDTIGQRKSTMMQQMCHIKGVVFLHLFSLKLYLL